MLSDKAEVEILFHCFYMPLGVKEGHPILSIRWPLTPMPEADIGQVFEELTFNLGSTNTVLIRDEGVNIIVDPGILQLGRYGAFQKRLGELGLSLDEIDLVVNTHCHYDHIEANYLFRGKPLVVHERELDYCGELYWPEFTEAFMGILKVNAINGSKKLTKNVRVIETLGHTPGSISVIADTSKGLVACIGDAAIVREDLLEFRGPSVVTKNIAPEVSIESLKMIASLKPYMVVPGHDAPFDPETGKGL
ncbi:MAG: MBL fold metallo-hydrolase [Candidatus Bathyarchaeota archaeon]|jgi:glyoxylase-like metal-dependent hydrolase (beta-lactamase superfamily II)